MHSLALQKTNVLIDEWTRLRRFLIHGRPASIRDHAAATMLRIEKELAARRTDKKP